MPLMQALGLMVAGITSEMISSLCDMTNPFIYDKSALDQEVILKG